MNYLKRYDAIRRLKLMIVHQKYGCYYHKQNGDEHENWKWHCYKILKEKCGQNVMTESTVKGKNGKIVRPDLIGISEEGIGVIIEILNTETDLEFEEKTRYYPKDEFEIIKCKVGEEPELPF